MRLVVRRLAFHLLLALALAPASALDLEGLVFESEAIARPESAWLLNQRTADRWMLWTQEEDIHLKRSGGAVLASPPIAADRARPEDGAPPLHCVVDALPPGAYVVFLSGPGRPLAYSLDGEQWVRYAGGEVSLGVQACPGGRFEFWIDDRFAHPPTSPGPGYFDYVRFIPVASDAAQVVRHSAWRRAAQDVAALPGGLALAGGDLLADGFTGQPGQPAASRTVGATLRYRATVAGRYHLGLVAADSPAGYEELEFSLNGRKLGTAVGAESGQAVFALREPVQLVVGDTITVTNRSEGLLARVDHLLLSPEPLRPPPPRVEHLTAWSPAAGSVSLCWTTSEAMPTGRFEYQSPGGEPAVAEGSITPGRNHRVRLTELDPTTEFRGRVVTSTEAGHEVVSAEIAFRAAPPQPAASQAFTVDLSVTEPTSAARRGWPAVIGVPFAPGQLADPADLRLAAPGGAAIPVQAEVFSRWPDGSVKWAVVSFAADSDPSGPVTYRLSAGRTSTGSPTAGSTAQVAATAAGWTVTTPHLAFDLPRDRPALFHRVGIDRNADGQIAADERIGAAPLGANLKLEAGDGSFLTCGPAESFEVAANGPVRAVLVWGGSLVGPAGPSGWRYQIEATVYQTLPTLSLNVTVNCAAADPVWRPVKALALRAPLDGFVAVRGGFDGSALAPVPDADGLWLHQAHDDRYTTRDGASGRRAVGVATATDGRTRLDVVLRDFWQTYPSGFAVKPDGIHIRLLPELAPDTYDAPTDREWFSRLYAWFDQGHYLFRAGQSTQHDVVAWYSTADGPAPDPAALAAWVNQPLAPQPGAAHVLASGAFGQSLLARTPGVWDEYEAYVERGLQASLADRENRRTYGYMHFGDWFGERHLNYGNNEYDLSWAAALHWLRGGGEPFYRRAWEMARHYATVDTVHGDFASGLNGTVWTHSFNHLGTGLPVEKLHLPDDPATRNYLREYNGLLRGAIDRQGHIYQGGNWLLAALTGERWLRETAVAVSDNQATHLTRSFDFGIERAGGWPLLNAVQAYDFSGDPFYLNAARLMVERCLDREDPATGGWPHNPPLSETDGVRVSGGKAFAVGILTNALLRYLEQEPADRPDVRQMLVRAADWLMYESWVPGQGFRYITNAPNWRERGIRGTFVLLNTEVVAYAAEQTGDQKYADFWREMIAGMLAGQPSGNGKNFSMEIRQTAFGLGRAARLGITRVPRQAVVRHRGAVRLHSGRGELILTAENPTDAPLPVRVEITAGAQPAEVAWTVPADARGASPPLPLVGEPGEARLRISHPGVQPREATIALVAAPPIPEAATVGQGIGYLGPPESYTLSGFAAAGFELPRLDKPDLASMLRHGGLVVASDSWAAPSVNLPALAPELQSYVAAGGRLMLWQLNDSHWREEYLPFDLWVFEPNSTLGQVTAPDHVLFRSLADPGALVGAVCYDTLGPVGAPWQVLATDAEGNPAIVEAPFGHGRILVVEPSIDRYAAGQADDAAVAKQAALAFCRGALAWLRGED